MGEVKRNRLKVFIPTEATTFGRIELNGQELKNIASLRVDIPEGKDTPLVKVSIEFYASLDLDIALDAVAKEGTFNRLVAETMSLAAQREATRNKDTVSES